MAGRKVTGKKDGKTGKKRYGKKIWNEGRASGGSADALLRQKAEKRHGGGKSGIK